MTVPIKFITLLADAKKGEINCSAIYTITFKITEIIIVYVRVELEILMIPAKTKMNLIYCFDNLRILGC